MIGGLGLGFGPRRWPAHHDPDLVRDRQQLFLALIQGPVVRADDRDVRSFRFGICTDALAEPATTRHLWRVTPGKISRIDQIPFLDSTQLGRSRFVPCLTFHADGVWRIWLQIDEPNQFIEISGTPAEAHYWAAAPEAPEDFTTAFLNFIAQHSYQPGLTRSFSGFNDDLLNLSAALNKLEVLHRENSPGGARMAGTELEGVLATCRSLFDLLQEMLRCIWAGIELMDKSIHKNGLPRSFADVVMKGGEVRTVDALRAAYGLPPEIAEVYVRHTPIFLKLRQFRDDTIHRAKSLPHIYVGETDFLITRAFGPFEVPNIWRENEIQPNNLGPLRPVLAMTIQHVLRVFDDFAHALTRVIRFPPPLVPDMVFYSRGYFHAGFLLALKDANARVLEGRGLMGPPPLSD